MKRRRRLPAAPTTEALRPDAIARGNARAQTARIAPGSVDLALWSPPYLVGKSYERGLDLSSWTKLIDELFALHARVLRPGRFAVVDIADVLAWPDPALGAAPAATDPDRRGPVTADQVAAARRADPAASNAALARRLGCSEQTVSRRLRTSAHRSGRRPRTRVLATSALVEQAADKAGLHLCDHRIWAKTPAWKNNAWHASSYRSVDEWEQLLFFQLPGPFVYDRSRLDPAEWAEWGSRGIWRLPSARHDRHEAPFPAALAARVIRLLSDPGDTVLDPFVGSVTTTAAARLLGRRWIGIDKDPEAAALAVERTASTAWAPPAPSETDTTATGQTTH